MSHLALPLCVAALAAVPSPAAPRPVPIERFLAEPTLVPVDAAAIAATCDRYLARAAALRTAMEADEAPASLATVTRFDDIALILGASSDDAGVLAATAPDEPRRAAARRCLARANDAMSALQLSRRIYDRLKAVPLAGADGETRHVLRRTLARFDRAGVALDSATRARIAALNERIGAREIRFAANIADGRKTVAADPAELDGLPADYVAAHPAGADGRVVISTDYPDLNPVMNYARSEALRRRLYMANATRAWPANDAVLRDLIAGRNELATILGRADFATLSLEENMIDSPAEVGAFLAEIARVGDAHARRDDARMLERLRRDEPGAITVPLWSDAYASQLIRKERYALDAQEVRRYFAYDKVRDGILQLTRDLMDVEIRPWKTAVWDPSVEPYEMLDHGTVIGRFYFDTHPRPGKFSHAAVMSSRVGVEGRSLPVAALVTNFPAGDHRTGLMEHRDVETFLHEYGHLLHVLMSGGKRYSLSSMAGLEGDFIEAPSKMLENFVWDYATLTRFAVDADGRTIPRALVDKMNEARYFGEALRDRRQLGFANVSLDYHRGPPQADLTAHYARSFAAFDPHPIPSGAHPQTAFPHLGGYAASYYKYMWSQTIALDLLTRFEKEGLRNPAVARAYRDTILAPGGSKPAATLVEDFLGRPPSLDAYRVRLAKGD